MVDGSTPFSFICHLVIRMSCDFFCKIFFKHETTPELVIKVKMTIRKVQ